MVFDSEPSSYYASSDGLLVVLKANRVTWQSELLDEDDLAAFDAFSPDDQRVFIVKAILKLGIEVVTIALGARFVIDIDLMRKFFEIGGISEDLIRFVLKILLHPEYYYDNGVNVQMSDVDKGDVLRMLVDGACKERFALMHMVHPADRNTFKQLLMNFQISLNQ